MSQLNKLQELLGFTQEYSLTMELKADRTDPQAPLYLRNETLTVVNKEPAFLRPLQAIFRQTHSHNEVKDYDTLWMAMYLGFDTDRPEILSAIEQAADYAVATGDLQKAEVTAAREESQKKIQEFRQG